MNKGKTFTETSKDGGQYMSGGHFDYAQFRFGDVALEIDELIRHNDKRGTEKFSDETIEEFKNAAMIVKLAQIYVHRIDWLVSGDDGEETFMEKLGKDKGRAGCTD